MSASPSFIEAQAIPPKGQSFRVPVFVLCSGDQSRRMVCLSVRKPRTSHGSVALSYPEHKIASSGDRGSGASQTEESPGRAGCFQGVDGFPEARLERRS